MTSKFRVRFRGLLILAVAAVATFPAGAQERATGLKLSGDQPIQIESDRLEVRENDSMAVFSGNVNVVQGDTQLKSGRMTVFYAQGQGSVTTGQSNIERLEVDGKVYLRSKNQIATGDSGTFNMLTEELVLLGKEVVLTEGDNVVVGCKLTVQMASGLAKLDGCGGRVKTLITPQSRP